MGLNIEVIESDIPKLVVDGRVDTTTSAELDSAIEGALTNTNSLMIDCENLAYISSAGLRVLLKTQKAVSANGGVLKLIHVNESVREIFEITGFIDFLTIE